MKKAKILGASLAALLAVGYLTGQYIIKPRLEEKIRPLVEQKLNTAINGTIESEPIKIGWSGVYADDVIVKNEQKQIVLKAKKITVGLSPIGIIKVGLKQADSLRALGNIEVDRTIIYLDKVNDDKWNIDNLIKKQKTSTPMEYRGKVIIKDGVVNINNNNIKQQINAINGVIKCDDYPNIKGSVTFKSNNDYVATTFAYNKQTNDWQVYLDTKKFDIANLKVLLPENIKFENLKGFIKDANITLYNKNGQYNVNGSTRIVDLELKYKDYEITKGQINLIGKESKFAIPKAECKVNGQLITLKGMVDLKEKTQNLQAYLVENDLEKLTNKKEISGKINAKADITGTWKSPKVKGDAILKNINYKNQEFNEVKITANYEDGVASIDKAIINSANGAMSAFGWYNNANKKYHFTINADNFSLDKIYTPVKVNLTGKVDILGQGENINKVEANFVGNDFIYNDNYIGTIEGNIVGSENKYLLKKLNIGTKTGVLKAVGTYESDNLDIQVKGNNVSLEPIAKFIKQDGEGTVNLTGKITGTLQSPKVYGQFASNGGKIRRLNFEGAAADFYYEDKRIYIKNGVVLAGKGACDVTGSVGISSDSPLDLDLKANWLRAENVSKLLFNNLPVTGNLSGDLKISGTINNVDILGDLELKDGSVLGEIVTDANGKFTYKDKILNVSELKANVYDARILGSGIMNDKELNFKFTGENMELARLIHLPTYKVSGRVKAEGFITGTLDDPKFKGNANSEKITINDVELTDIYGDLYVDNNVIAIHEAKFNQGIGRYLYSGGIKLKSKELFGYAKVSNAPVAGMLKVINAPIYNLNGELNGDVDLGGTLKSPNLKVKGEVINTTINEKNMGTSDIDLNLENGRFEITKFRMPMEKGFIAAAGKAQLDGDVDIQLAANETPIEDLMSLIGKKMPIEGMVEGVVNITGKTNNPKMQLSTSVHNVNYNGVRLDNVFMLATLKAGVLDINQILAEQGKYKVKLNGKLPLAALSASEKIPKSVDNRMDVNVDITEADLGVIPLFTSYVTYGDGDIIGKVHITGPMDNMNIDGRIDLKKGSLNLLTLKQPIENINAAIVFEGQKANINIGGNIGKGQVLIEGDANWGLNKPFDYNLHLFSKDVVLESKFFEGPLKADFTLTKKDDNPLIKGKLDLSNDTINIPLEFADTQSEFNPMLDLEIIANEPVRLYNPILYDIPVVGEINFKGTKKSPIGSGLVQTRMGTIKYLNNRFQIKEGKAKFNRLNTFLPNIDIKADTTVTDYVVDMNLSGPVEQMNLKLTSEPALNEEQILSLLTLRSTNFDTSQLQENAMNTIVSAGLQMVVFGSVENAVQNKLGIDRFAITNNYLDPYKLRENTSNNNTNSTPFTYYSLEIGKTLFPKFVLTYGVGLNYDLSRFGFNYKLSKHLATEAWFTDDDNYYYGLKYKVQF